MKRSWTSTTTSAAPSPVTSAMMAWAGLELAPAAAVEQAALEDLERGGVVQRARRRERQDLEQLLAGIEHDHVDVSVAVDITRPRSRAP
jgi:hypothetical protein